MKKRASVNMAVNTLHKGFVCACVGVTLYGTYLLGWRFYRYFTVIKPQREQRELLEKQNLLAEGSSENLADLAPKLRT